MKKVRRPTHVQGWPVGSGSRAGETDQGSRHTGCIYCSRQRLQPFGRVNRTGGIRIPYLCPTRYGTHDRLGEAVTTFLDRRGRRAITTVD